MSLLYRVFPWLATARAGAPGHALHLPGSGAGRIDNPDRYRTLYASDGPGGACAEAFAYQPRWSAGMLRGSPALPGSVRALATYEVDDDLVFCDLDDAVRLVERGLRPSQVVTRDRLITQAWALRIHGEGRWAGIRWWSYHDPRWGSHGLWDVDRLRVARVVALELDHPGILEAADVLNRPLAVRGDRSRL